MVQCLSDQDPAPKDLSSPIDPVQDFSRSIHIGSYDFSISLQLLLSFAHSNVNGKYYKTLFCLK